ncbi:MAG: hypothetical protein Q4A52_07680 [Bacillota bacterium]|nr:hypothetical protein [Bacillota bacterium]
MLKSSRGVLIGCLSALLLIALFGCRFSDAVREQVEQDVSEARAKGAANRISYGESTTEAPALPDGIVELVWAVPTISGHSLRVDGVNQYLAERGKSYRVRLEFDDSTKKDGVGIGEQYWNFLKNRLAKGDVDIVHFGFKSVEFNHFLDQSRAGIVDFSSDFVATDRLIREGMVRELDVAEAIDRSTLYDGKCYGLGNFTIGGPVGFFWTEQIAGENIVGEAPVVPWERVERLQKFQDTYNRGMFQNQFSIASSRLFHSGLGDVVAVRADGEVVWIPDTDEYRRIQDGLESIRARGWEVSDGGDSPAVIFGMLSNAEEVEPMENGWYRAQFGEKLCYFSPYSIAVDSRNYLSLESGIATSSRHAEEALDFLRLLYTDPECVRVFESDNAFRGARRYYNEWLSADMERLHPEHRAGVVNGRYDGSDGDPIDGFVAGQDPEIDRILGSFWKILGVRPGEASPLLERYRRGLATDEDLATMKEAFQKAGGEELLRRLREQIEDYLKKSAG